MATVKLIPRTVYNGSSYLTVTDSDRMLTNTDSTTYGTVQCTRSSTSSYYVYLRDFDFSLVPSNATVSNITIKVKGYQSGGNTSTLYMYSGTGTQVSACGSGTAFTTSASVITFSNTTIDWNTLKNYGSDLGVRINCRRSSKNKENTIYIYGAEIDVTYSLPVYHTVTITGTNVTPSGAQTVLEGSSLSITGGYSPKPTVTDNGVDVSSRLVQVSSGSVVLIPDGNTSTGFTVSNISNAYTDASSSTYASLELSGGTTGTIYLGLGGATIPSGATIQSVSCSATLQFNANGSGSGFTSSFQMYSGSTAKGSANNWVTEGSDVAKTTYNLSIGSWSASDIQNAKFYITATNNASSTKRYIYVYGVSFSVTYSISGVLYVYTLSNITADHTIVWTANGGSTESLYFKNNGNWVEATHVYKKVNGSWVEQGDLTNVFQSGVNYIKGN